MQTESIQPVTTDRLILHCLSVEFLRSLSEGSIESAQRLVDYSVPDDCPLLGHRQINRRLKMAESMNFEIVGRHDDPIDGLEFVMKAEIERILKAKKA